MLTIQARSMKDIFGQALLDFYHDSFKPPLLLHNEYGSPEVIPIERYFIDYDEYSDLELFAMQHFQGKTLDVGAATGRHTLHLQDLGFDVSAMDLSNNCSILMEKLGVEKIIIDDIYKYKDNKYDTISMLMNGIGLAGNIENLKKLLSHLKNILNPSGQILADSSDISYLYEGEKLPEDKYFGELNFQYEYKGELDDPFDWLYIDPSTLTDVAKSAGWNCQIIFEDDTQAFLARLQPL